MLLYEHYVGKTPFQIKYSVNQSRITKTIFLFNFFFFFFLVDYILNARKFILHVRYLRQ